MTRGGPAGTVGISSQRDKHKGRVLNQLLKTVGKSCYCCPCQQSVIGSPVVAKGGGGAG